MLRKTIMCFGDSLTWGFNPKTSLRHEYSNLLTTHITNKLYILQSAHNVNMVRTFNHSTNTTKISNLNYNYKYNVVNAGLCGRTTMFDDPYFENVNGLKALPIFLSTFSPIDIVVIMLGTNDSKPYISKSPNEIALGMLKLVSVVKASGPKVLIVCPPKAFSPNLNNMKLFFKGVQMHGLAEEYNQVGKFTYTPVLDASEIKPSEIDGVHLDEKGNEILGDLIGQKLFDCFIKNDKK